ncbi:MAG: glutamate racemase [Bacilli bacterium]|nr:glutamate racemase [Bacilli bacterium]
MGKIGVFDSGIGGYSVLEKLKELMPFEEYVYYKDSDNLPYGSKSDEELFKIGFDIVSYLVSAGCSTIVIACNTMTTKCIKRLRESFPDIIFVGTEPAIKVACDRNYKNILVMATPATIKSDCVSRLVENNKKDFQNIYLAACDGLARAIEDDDKVKINVILKNVLDKYKNNNIDCIVLGCTHYTFVKDEIRKIINADFVDGSLGVAKQVRRKLKKDFIS